jgi:uncharacterized membrane protein
MDDATTGVLLGSFAFAAPHLLLGFPPLRPWLASRLGEERFTAVFAGVAAVGLGVFAAALAIHGGDGVPGPGGGFGAPVRVTVVAIGLAGLVLAMAALGAYPRSPAALFRQGVHPPRGVEKISRHGFFVGFGVFCATNALLAPTMALAAAFGVLGAVCAIGAVFQDTKLRRRHGAAWDDYRRQTSVVPGLALLQARTRIDAADRMGRVLARAAAGAALLVVLHPVWVLAHGATFVGALALGGVLLSVRRFRRARGPVRPASPPAG